MSVEALPKLIDSSQLPQELDGTLIYDHSHWIEMRMVSKTMKSLLKFRY